MFEVKIHIFSRNQWSHRQEVRQYLETDEHVAGLSLNTSFVDKKENTE